MTDPRTGEAPACGDGYLCEHGYCSHTQPRRTSEASPAYDPNSREANNAPCDECGYAYIGHLSSCSKYPRPNEASIGKVLYPENSEEVAWARRLHWLRDHGVDIEALLNPRERTEPARVTGPEWTSRGRCAALLRTFGWTDSDPDFLDKVRSRRFSAPSRDEQRSAERVRGRVFA